MTTSSGASRSSAGSVKRNVVPAPTVLSAQTVDEPAGVSASKDVWHGNTRRVASGHTCVLAVRSARGEVLLELLRDAAVS